MKQTQADKKAARDGFRYVVIRHGERIAYTTTLGEAKRECGKSGKVVAISGMTYAAKNPHKRRNPMSAAAYVAQIKKIGKNGGLEDWDIHWALHHPSEAQSKHPAQAQVGRIFLKAKKAGLGNDVMVKFEESIGLLANPRKHRNPISSHGGEMSRSKAEAAYARADRAYTKAVEAYGGFDDRTVAAYRRRQKAEQVLHATLRINPSVAKKRRYIVAYGGGETAPLGSFASKDEAKQAMLAKVAQGKMVGGYVSLAKPKYRNPDAGEGQAEPSVLAALGYKIGKYTRKGIRGTKSFVSKAREGWQAGKQNPAGKARHHRRLLAR